MQEKDLMEKDCLSFEGFCTCIRLDIRHRMENVQVECRKVLKVNDVKKTGLVILEEGRENVLPMLYLEEFYEEYLHGRSIGQIEEKILDVYRTNCPECPPDMSPFADWGWASERIVFRIVSLELNREYIKNVPHVPYLDLAVVFYCRLDETELGEASIPVFNSHLRMWGITVEELHATAVENTPKMLPPEIQSMGEILKDFMGAELTGELNPPMYVLSNRRKSFGSACILYQGVLAGFADRMGTDLFILPSSLHEVLLIPAEKGADARMLDQMVQDVNAGELQQEEILSDHVYRYSRETGKITMKGETE